MPVESFIEYYCIIFATNNEQEHFEEKQSIYKEYKQIVGSNLQNFLKNVLKMNASSLVALMSLYDGDYECLEYVLAVEDYSIFHKFMYETNFDLD